MKSALCDLTTGGITGAENEYEGLGCHCLYVFKGIITGSNRLGIRGKKQEALRWVNDNSSAVPYQSPTNSVVLLARIGEEPYPAWIAHAKAAKDAKPRRGPRLRSG
jgi:hypothetical protein